MWGRGCSKSPQGMRARVKRLPGQTSPLGYQALAASRPGQADQGVCYAGKNCVSADGGHRIWILAEERAECQPKW